MCNQIKFKHPRLSFVLVFVSTVIFQMLVNRVGFTAEQPITEADDASQFAVEVFGQSGNDTQSVILIPGLMSDGRVWDSLVGVLSVSYQVHLINIAGFANTPAIDTPSLSSVKQQLLAYIDAHKLHKPAVIGHSLGGFMSFWVSSSAPSKIGPIISVDGLPFIGPVFTGTDSSTVESLASQAQQIQRMYRNMSQQQLIDQSRYALSIQASSDKAKAKVMAMVQISNPKAVGEAVYSLMSHDLRQDIANITSPVLLLGASGGFSTDEQKSAMHTLYAQQLQALPKAQLLMNTNSRHFIMFDDPKWLEEQVMSFLGTHL
jgi:pimeloyl-ACP methyl ester carboxylesterase